MDYKYQDIVLLNDIIDRNYYYYFKRGNNKNICLTFYYNNKFNNTNLIPGFPVPESNINNILLHLNLFLDMYISQEFCCNIKINDEFWLTDSNKDKIVNVFIEKFKDVDKKPKEIEIICNAVHCLNDGYKWFLKIKKDFQNIGIDLKLKLETMLIDIVDIQYLFEIKTFILENVEKLKVRINPNNFAYFIEIYQAIYHVFKPVLYLYEENNVNWTDFKINEYLEFLNNYIDFIYKEVNYNDVDFIKEIFLNENLGLISLKDNGVFDDSNSRGQCSFFQSLNILLEDLTINLCPKFQYDDQIIGQYLYDENGITKIDPKYLGLISMNIHLKRSSTPHCETCPFVIFCKGFCCKESYKYCLNPIIPIRESCELQRAKYAFLFYKLKHLNVFTLENIKQLENLHPFYISTIMDLYNTIGGGIQNV